MKIHNIKGLPTVDYRTVQPFQGGLKDLSEDNGNKLLRVLEKRGFTSPLQCWLNPIDQKLYLLDGHQRQRILLKHDLNDSGSYEVPYMEIPAKDEKEAREELLEIDSRYGRTTVDGFDEFAFDLDIAELDISLSDIDLDKLIVDEPDSPEKPDSSLTKKYTTDQLRELAKSYYPADLQTITGFLAVVDDRA